eukprot:8144647-Pyramimonas_sp.AAC.1
MAGGASWTGRVRPARLTACWLQENRTVFGTQARERDRCFQHAGTVRYLRQLTGGSWYSDDRNTHANI